MSAAREATIKLWAASPILGERVISIPSSTVPSGDVTNFAFSTNGEHLMILVGNRVCFWDATSGERLEETGEEAHPDMSSLDQRYRLKFGPAGMLFVREESTGREQLIQHKNHLIRQAKFSPDGSLIAAKCSCGEIHILDTNRGAPLRTGLTDFEDPTSVLDFAFSPDGMYLAACRRNGTVLVCDARTLQPLLPPFEHPNTVLGVTFTPDGKRIVTVGTDVRVWNAETGELLTSFGEAHDFTYYRVTSSPNGRSIAATTIRNALGTRLIKIWDAADPRDFDTPTTSSGTP